MMDKEWPMIRRNLFTAEERIWMRFCFLMWVRGSVLWYWSLWSSINRAIFPTCFGYGDDFLNEQVLVMPTRLKKDACERASGVEGGVGQRRQGWLSGTVKTLWGESDRFDRGHQFFLCYVSSDPPSAKRAKRRKWKSGRSCSLLWRISKAEQSSEKRSSLRWRTYFGHQVQLRNRGNKWGMIRIACCWPIIEITVLSEIFLSSLLPRINP